MNTTLIVLSYTVLCVVVAWYFSKKGSGFSVILFWAILFSPLGAIILGLRRIANKKLRRMEFSLKS